MNKTAFASRGRLQFAALAFTLALGTAAIAQPGNYVVHNLVSDQAGVADHQDPNLRNAWGIVFGPTNPVWVSDNFTGVSTVYDGAGNLLLTVTIPGGANTGITLNPSMTDFQITCGTPPNQTTASALFLGATENGTIAAWRGGVGGCGSTAVVPPTATSANAVYKGIAIAGDGGTHFRLFAADLFNGKID